MKKSKIFTTVIGFLLIAIVACIGVYAVMSTVKIIKSKLAIDVGDQGLEFVINGTAEWANATDLNRTFTSQTTSAGVNNNVWNIPKIQFSSEQNTEFKKAVMTVAITNHSSVAINASFVGIAYDKDRTSSSDYRFTTTVFKKIGDSAKGAGVQISTNQYLVENIEEDTTVSIIIEYELVMFNSNFTFNQDINLTITSQGGSN